MSSLVEIGGPVVLEKKMKISEVYRKTDRETERRTDGQTDRRRTLGDQESSHELYAQVSYKSYGSDPNLHRQKNTTFTSITVEYFILQFQIKKVFTEICIALYKICINFQN